MKKDKERSNDCPCCAISSMFEALESMHEWANNFAAGAVGEDADYKASQLDVAFISAEGTMLLLRDLFREFTKAYFPDRIEQHKH